MSQEIILHIDDSPEIRNFVRTFLSAHGYQIIQAKDGPSGLEMIRQLKPRLVLLDLDMPGMSGLDVIKQVKADPELGQVRVIAFTGSTIPDDRAELMAAGFDDFLAKPTTILNLLSMIQTHYSAGSPAK